VGRTGERQADSAGPGPLLCVALDFGGTISTDREDHLIGQKAVDPEAAVALHELAGLGLRLILATNASAAETRWPTLQLAGVHELFAVGLVSYSLNVSRARRFSSSPQPSLACRRPSAGFRLGAPPAWEAAGHRHFRSQWKSCGIPAAFAHARDFP
jgi:hypothetical protein